MTEKALAALLALAAAGLVATYLDSRHRTLPNWLCLMLGALRLAAAFRFGGIEVLGAHLIHGAAALCVGIILFSQKVIGGGDGKYYAAAACWFPIAQGFILLFCVSIAGFLLYTFWYGTRRLRGLPIDPDPDAETAAKLPYGLAIAGGSISAALFQLL